jgi:hypothetical protein
MKLPYIDFELKTVVGHWNFTAELCRMKQLISQKKNIFFGPINVILSDLVPYIFRLEIPTSYFVFRICIFSF